MRYAEELRRTQQAMQHELCDISKNQKGKLRIGIAFTRGRTVMPRLIAAFQKKFPNVEIALVEDSNEALQKLLINGDIDLAAADFGKVPQEVELRDFYNEHMVLCLSDALIDRCGFDLAAHESALRGGDLSSLRGCPFVLGCAADIGGRIGRELLRRSDVKPIVKATSENIETLLELCEQGVGACFSPENLVHTALGEERASHLHLVHFENGASYPIRFGYRRDTYQWSLLEAFIRTAQEGVR